MIALTLQVWTLFDTDDLTWWAAPYWVTSEVEICTAMICACMPSLRPLFGRMAAKRAVIVDTITLRRSFSRSSHAGSIYASAEENGQGPWSTYSTYWKTIDVEGIGVDGFGYTVTITAERNRNLQRGTSRLSRLFNSEKDTEEGTESDAPAPAPSQAPLMDRIFGQRRIPPTSRRTKRQSPPLQVQVTEEVLTEALARPTRISSSNLSRPLRHSNSISRQHYSGMTPSLTQARSMSPLLNFDGSSAASQMAARRSMTPILNPHNSSAFPPMAYQHAPARSISPSIQPPMTVRTMSPVLLAPVASRRISPDFVHEPPSLQQEYQRNERATFYCDSDDGSSISDR
jgi:hypothetical protein